MTIMNRILAGGAGLAALAAAGPAAAQYGAYSYGYGYGANVTQVAAQRCAAAVQNRLNNSRSNGLAGILGTVLGAHSAQGRVLSVTRVDPNRNSVRVRGLATSGRSPYGAGAYGSLAYNYRPDLSFRCTVDYRGFVRDVDINRR